MALPSQSSTGVYDGLPVRRTVVEVHIVDVLRLGLAIVDYTPHTREERMSGVVMWQRRTLCVNSRSLPSHQQVDNNPQCQRSEDPFGRHRASP